MIFIFNTVLLLTIIRTGESFVLVVKMLVATCINNKIIQHLFFHFHIGLLYRCHYAAVYVLAASNQDVLHPFSL